MIDLQPLTTTDLSRCRTLDDGPHPWPRPALARALDQGQGLGLVQNGTLKGFLIADSVLDETSLLHLAVGLSFQGKGVARAGLQSWLAALVKQSQQRCFLEVRAGNERAIRLYESVGFECIGRRNAYYVDGTATEDALVMAKSLTGES